MGTGKYKSLQEADLAIQASGAEIVTVAIRRVNIGQHPDQPTYCPWPHLKNIPFYRIRQAVFDANSAVRTCMLARELLDGHNRSSWKYWAMKKRCIRHITLKH